MSMAIVTLKKGEGRTLKAGGAWIYDNEIESIKNSLANGNLIDTSKLENVKTVLNDVSNITGNLYDRFDSEILGNINTILNTANDSAKSALEILQRAQDKLPKVEEILTTVSALCNKGNEGIKYANVCTRVWNKQRNLLCSYRKISFRCI